MEQGSSQHVTINVLQGIYHLVRLQHVVPACAVHVQQALQLPLVLHRVLRVLQDSIQQQMLLLAQHVNLIGMLLLQALPHNVLHVLFVYQVSSELDVVGHLQAHVQNAQGLPTPLLKIHTCVMQYINK